MVIKRHGRIVNPCYNDEQLLLSYNKNRLIPAVELKFSMTSSNFFFFNFKYIFKTGLKLTGEKDYHAAGYKSKYIFEKWLLSIPP